MSAWLLDTNVISELSKAREYGLTVAMRNTKHFPFCPIVNPFDQTAS
jgi:predicted nucleic acid-binding protein